MFFGHWYIPFGITPHLLMLALSALGVLTLCKVLQLKHISWVDRYITNLTTLTFVISFSILTLSGLGFLPYISEIYIHSIYAITLTSGVIVLWYRKDIGINIFSTKHTPTRAPYSVWHILLILAGIAVLASQFYVRELNTNNFYGDEFLVVDAAVGYINTDTFYRWDWLKNTSGAYTDCMEISPTIGTTCHYTRAWPHTWLVAQSIQFFGLHEGATRFVSAILGIICIPLFYAVFRALSFSQHVSLLLATIIPFTPGLVEMFRYTRMYALLIPSVLVLLWLIYRTLSFAKDNDMKRTIFNALGALLLFVFCIIVHINTLVIAFGVLLYLLYATIQYKNTTLYMLTTLAAIGSVLLTVLLTLGNYTTITEQVTFFASQNYAFFELLGAYPFPLLPSSILFILAGYLLYSEKHTQYDALRYLWCIVFGAIIFFVFIADRYVAFNYISHIVPIFVSICMVLFFYLTQLLNRAPKIALWAICIFSITTISVQGWYTLHTQGSEKYTVAYQEINTQFNTHTDILIGQYVRGIYLDALQEKGVVHIDLLNQKQFSYDDFLTAVNGAHAGWVTWETKKRYHIDDNIRLYAEMHFTKLHGENVDDTGIEVYYFTSDAGDTRSPLRTS
ncbi:MAG: glycosyltransferase family 39 protein [Candidatus Pacebacteria bacterium]|nr:glycosyltransferase family 39 protein [Candidatus Paceibacterota bacterium]